jgi:hypothetical protein
VSSGVVSYTEFMVVGIDQGVLCCNSCGALVPADRTRMHDAFHVRLRRLEQAEAGK